MPFLIGHHVCYDLGDEFDDRLWVSDLEYVVEV